LKGTFAITFIVILCLSIFSVFASKVNAQQSSADWPMFRSDPSHSGAGGGNLVVTPTVLWKYPICNNNSGMDGVSSTAVVGGVVYIGSYEGYVYALNASDGAKLWSYGTGYPVDSSPAVVGGVVYVEGTWDHNVYALDASNGAKLWNYTTAGGSESSPAVVGGAVYIGSDDGYVYALDASNGVKLWSYFAGYGSLSSPAVVSGVVYIGSGNNNVYALNASVGAKLWSYNTGNWVTSSPAVVDGVVYINSGGGFIGAPVFNGSVYALDASNGTQLWSYYTSGGMSSPAVVGGVVYIGSDNDVFYALNATSGVQLWNYTADGGFLASSAVVGGVVYVSSDNGKIYALNASTGGQFWNYTAGGGFESSPAVVDSVVYVSSDDGNVYALGSSTASSSSHSQTPTTSPTFSAGPVNWSLDDNTLFIFAGVVGAVVIIAALVFLTFRKKLKTKPTSPPPTAYTTELHFSFHCSNIPRIVLRLVSRWKWKRVSLFLRVARFHLRELRFSRHFVTISAGRLHSLSLLSRLTKSLTLAYLLKLTQH
jgi:outer membrane protein assembly factor BamB